MVDYYDLTYIALSEPEVMINTYCEELVDDTGVQFKEITSDSASTLEVGDGNIMFDEPQSSTVVQFDEILLTPGENGTVVEECEQNFKYSKARRRANRTSRKITDHFAVSMEDIKDRAHIELEHCYTAYNKSELDTIVKYDQISVVPRKRNKRVKKPILTSKLNRACTRSQNNKRKLETKHNTHLRQLRSHGNQMSNAEQTPIHSKQEVIEPRKSSTKPRTKRDHSKISSVKNYEMKIDESTSPMDFLAIELNKPAKRPIVETKSYILTALIGEALLNSEDGCLTSTEILEYISKTHPQYNVANNKRLKSCFHDVLCRKPHFTGIPRKEGQKAKRWKINPSYVVTIKEMITQREMLNVENVSDHEPFQYFVDATMIEDDVSINGYLPSAGNEQETTRNTNPIESDNTFAPTGGNVNVMPAVISYSSSGSSSFPIERAIESISQQECRESPATHASSEMLSFSSEDDEIVIEEKVTTLAESTVVEQECPICDQMFSSNESLGAHMSVHRKRPRLSGPLASPVTNSLVVSSSNDSHNFPVANGPTVSPCRAQNDENTRRALNSLPSSLFSGQRPIIFMGSVYFNHS